MENIVSSFWLFFFFFFNAIQATLACLPSPTAVLMCPRSHLSITPLYYTIKSMEEGRKSHVALLWTKFEWEKSLTSVFPPLDSTAAFLCTNIDGKRPQPKDPVLSSKWSGYWCFGSIGFVQLLKHCKICSAVFQPKLKQKHEWPKIHMEH